MKTSIRIVACALAILAGCGIASAGQPQPPATALNTPAQEELTHISALLDNYVTSVSTGNRALFESQLLDLAIPFSGIGISAPGVQGSGLTSVQNYAGFRKAIFDSGDAFQQRFSRIHIEQVGNLAQVSLDYETALRGTAYAGKGWKVMQLIKVRGDWKIAGEFFTAYPDSNVDKK